MNGAPPKTKGFQAGSDPARRLWARNAHDGAKYVPMSNECGSRPCRKSGCTATATHASAKSGIRSDHRASTAMGRADRVTAQPVGAPAARPEEARRSAHLHRVPFPECPRRDATGERRATEPRDGVHSRRVQATRRMAEDGQPAGVRLDRLRDPQSGCDGPPDREPLVSRVGRPSRSTSSTSASRSSTASASGGARARCSASSSSASRPAA